MKTFVPDYYPQFHCKAGACRKSCCIGWEIGIDADTLAYYRSVSGEFGAHLHDSIDEDEDGAHFRLCENERCPFLNSAGLCDIYIRCGKEHLSQICTDHPRFYNELCARREMGLGLACEAVGELLLKKQSVTRWILWEEDDADETSSAWEEAVFAERENILAVLQNRAEPLAERIFRLTDDVWYGRTPEQWREFYNGLERMETAWDDRLAYLNAENAECLLQAPAEGETVWEQLLVYFVNRHLADAADVLDLDARLAFAVLSYAVIRSIWEGECRKNGEASLAELIETARLYSAEIEYSEDNTAAVLDALEECLG
ncbi:MAG: flagellin lysine-N-methylase [Clostridia bacterium]|nr:flagellin lysine-N-methylase [Clostridia bacterium]MBQ9995131.1 flagellin lysine-N-methylase [Clostridia bacterium]